MVEINKNIEQSNIPDFKGLFNEFERSLVNSLTDWYEKQQNQNILKNEAYEHLMNNPLLLHFNEKVLALKNENEELIEKNRCLEQKIVQLSNQIKKNLDIENVTLSIEEIDNPLFDEIDNKAYWNRFGL